MIRLEMKNYSMILIEKQLKYQLYHQMKFININILLVKIVPSNQQQVIEQAKFTYSPLGKSFEKQIKPIEYQGQKHVKALKDLKSKEQTKAITYELHDDDDNLIKKNCNEILEERMDEILKMSKDINYSDLVYDFKGLDPLINFAIFGGPIILIIN